MGRPFDHPGKYESKAQFFRAESFGSNATGEHRIQSVPVFTVWSAFSDLGSGTVSDSDGVVEALLSSFVYRQTPYLLRDENIPHIGWIIRSGGKTFRVESVQVLGSYEIEITARTIHEKSPSGVSW